MKDEIINNVGETLGLNNWQAVAAIIGLTRKKKCVSTFKCNHELQSLFAFAWVYVAGAAGDS